MKKSTKKWLKFAEQDLKDAEALFEKERYFGCIYHCHQAVEKALKAVFVEKGKTIPRVHDLPDLLKRSQMRYSEEILDFLEELDPYYSPVRYPDVPERASLEFKKERAEQILNSVKETKKWIQYQIQE